LAAGGEFTASNTHEFQVPVEVGEDIIYVCEKCEYAENKEISKLKAGDKCLKCGGAVLEMKSVEVGNIFPLGTKYSEAFDLRFTDERGERKYVIMGSYGIGLGRVMGTIVEVFNDKDGIIWPESVAPFKAHLIEVKSEKLKVKKYAEKVYNTLHKAGIEVLYDNRKDVSAGEKFNDADLLGIPYRLVVSQKTGEKIEVKKRDSKKSRLIAVSALIKILS
jgi:prolyl-tRNA synthetase